MRVAGCGHEGCIRSPLHLEGALSVHGQDDECFLAQTEIHFIDNFLQCRSK